MIDKFDEVKPYNLAKRYIPIWMTLKIINKKYPHQDDPKIINKMKMKFINLIMNILDENGIHQLDEIMIYHFDEMKLYYLDRMKIKFINWIEYKSTLFILSDENEIH